MSLLRVAGLAIGLLTLVAMGLLRFRYRRLRNVEWLLSYAFALGLISLALFPDALDGLLGLFSFERGGGGRLIGLLGVSNLLLLLLVYLALARTTRLDRVADALVRELAKRDFRQAAPSGSRGAPIYAVIPAYNEADSIGEVLARMPSEVLGRRLATLVVVDGSSDGTGEVVRRLRHDSVTYIVNRGGGSALKAGYEIAIEDGAEVVVTLDADGQHRPEEIPHLVRPILDGEADLVCGSRVLGTHEDPDAVRSLGIALFNRLASLLARQRITDVSNSFRAVRAGELAKLELRQAQFHAAELLLEAVKKGLRVREVPVTVLRRRNGSSKKPRALRYGWGFAKAMLSTWLR